MKLFNLFKRKNKPVSKTLYLTSSKSLVFCDMAEKGRKLYCFDFKHRGCRDVHGIEEYADRVLLNSANVKTIISGIDDAVNGFRDKDLLEYDRYKDLEDVISEMKPDNVEVVFVKPRLHLKTCYGKDLFADENVSVMINKGASAEDIKAKYDLAVSRIDKEWIKSGRLKAINEQAKVEDEKAKRKCNVIIKEFKKRIKTEKEEFKDEKLDVSGHEKFFVYLMKKKSDEQLNALNFYNSISWAKLMQIEKRKNKGKLSKRIVNSTLEKAYGTPIDDIDKLLILENLAGVWKDTPDVVKYLEFTDLKVDKESFASYYKEYYEKADDLHCEELINELEKNLSKEEEKIIKTKINEIRFNIIKNREKGVFERIMADRKAEPIIPRYKYKVR